MTVVLFHVTFEANLQNIIENGLQPAGFHEGQGFSASIGDEAITEASQGKIYVVSKWEEMKPYIDHLNAKGEIKYNGPNTRIPVILRISIPLEEFEELDFYLDDTEVPLSSEPQSASWYFRETLSTGQVNH